MSTFWKITTFWKISTFWKKKQFFANMSPIYIFIILPEVFSCFFTSRDDNYHMTVVENIEIISWIIIITAPLMINIYLFFSFRTSFRLSNWIKFHKRLWSSIISFLIQKNLKIFGFEILKSVPPIKMNLRRLKVINWFVRDNCAFKPRWTAVIYR